MPARDVTAATLSSSIGGGLDVASSDTAFRLLLVVVEIGRKADAGRRRRRRAAANTFIVVGTSNVV